MLRGALYGLTAASIWGGLYVVSDIVLQTIPPFTLLTIRLVMGIAVLVALMWRTGQRLPPRPEIFRLLAIGVLGFGVSVGAQFVGTDKSTAVNGALVTSASPAFILVFAWLLLHERLTGRRILAVVLATIGVIVIIDPAKADFGSETFIGDMVLALAAVTWGLYSVLVRKVSAHHDTLVITLLAFIGGLFLTIPAMLLELPARPIGMIDGGTILGVLYLGFISTAGAMWLWNRAFALVDASVASLFFFAQPLVGAILSVVVQHQVITTNLWTGGLLIAGGVLLAMTRPKKSF